MPPTALVWACLSGIDPALNGNIVVYDVVREKILNIIPVGINPGDPAWFSEQSKVYVPNYGSNTLSIINSETLSPLKTLPVGIGPTTMAISDEESKAYVCNYEECTISVINLDQDEVIATISVGSNPLNLALAKNTQRLYVALQGENALSIIDTNLNKVVSTHPLNSQPNNLVLGTDESLLFIVQTSENRIAIIDLEHQQELATISTEKKPKNIVLHPTQPLAYITFFEEDSLSIISTEDYQILKTIPSIPAPFSLTPTPDGSILWIANDCQITAIDTTHNKIANIIYAPPSAQVRQGIAYTESNREFKVIEGFYHQPSRPYSFITEKIYFTPPRPFEILLHLEFPTPTAQAKRLTLGDAEVKAPSVSLLPIPLRPNYYYLTFAFRLPYKVFYKDDLNQSQELHGSVHHALAAIEIHLTPSRFSQNFNLKATTQFEVIKKLVIPPNSLVLTLRTQLVSLQQVHISE